jgi:SM-20-related protein
MPSPPSYSLSEKNIVEMASQDWTVIDGAKNSSFLNMLKAKAKESYHQGRFNLAKIGPHQKAQLAPQIRADEICWLDLLTECELSQELSTLKEQLNKEFFLNLKDIECHFTKYPPGAGYSEHLDRSTQSRHGDRVISLVLYLNERWQKDFGGELQIRKGSNIQQIEPLWGRMVLMKSDSVLHSVLPAKTERWSLTGWYRRS